MSKVIKILGNDFELEPIGVNAYYGSAECDDLHVLDQIREEVEAQGLETTLSKGEEAAWKLEFVT